MGFLFSKLWTKLLGKRFVSILMVGLDEAGKSTILYYLRTGKIPKTIQTTIWFNVETFEYKNLSFSVWDVGGQDKIRVLWKQYYKATEGIIFVVDSNDVDRIKDAGEELKKLMAEEDLKDCFVLVLANKQDLNGALPPNEITEILGMRNIKERPWLVQGTSINTGKGLKEALEWMASVLLKKKKIDK